MFDKPLENHIHAIATVIGTMGGFQPSPIWWQDASKTAIWQILVSSILVYQGGGRLDYPYSLTVAILFYVFITFTTYIKFSKPSENNLERFDNYTNI